MGRTVLSAQRLSQTKRLNIGKIIVFCEGKTEKYYFNYFAEIINKNKFTDIEVILESADGNAQSVLNCANNFLASEDNNRKYKNHGKYLVFDCDAPPTIQTVINEASDYKLLISNHLFETWLLMHFEDAEVKLTKQKIRAKLSEYLSQKYKKGHKGITREIIINGDIEKAIDNAKALATIYELEGKTIYANINEMNPYTNVYELIEQFLVEIS